MLTTVSLFRNTSDFKTCVAGETIFKEGQPGDVMFIVIEGDVDVLVRGKIVYSITGPGGVLGELALIDQEPRSATAVARTACKLVPIDRRKFSFLVQQTPYFAVEIMRTMAERLRHMNATV